MKRTLLISLNKLFCRVGARKGLSGILGCLSPYFIIPSQNITHRAALSCVVLLIILTACGPFAEPISSSSTPLPSGTPIQLPTIQVTPTPTDQIQPTGALGSEENPIVLGFVTPETVADIQASASAIVVYLSDETGLAIQSRVYDTYFQLLVALKGGDVHIAWLPPFTYLLAKDGKYGEAVLVANHFGVYSYGFQVFANVNSGFASYFNTQTNTSTATAGGALAQFHEKRPCWIDHQSASGFVIPLGYFNDVGLVLDNEVSVLSHTAVIRALYIEGICDFGVTYATYGDPRTAEEVQADLIDVMDKVIVIWQSEPIIPNLNVTFSPDFTGTQRQSLIDAFINYAKTDEGKFNLSAATNYDIQGFREIDDSFYAKFEEIFDASDVKISTLMGE